jgi:hypothetical protein
MSTINQIGSIILNITLLEKEYNNALIEYQQSYQTYINDLKHQQLNKPIYNILNGRTFLGTSGINQVVTNNINECKAMCSSIASCSGATFNSDNNNCWIRSGNGNVIPGSKSDNAIVSSIIQSSNKLKKLNANLEVINNKIIKAIDKSYDKYNRQIDIRNKYMNQLQNNYNELILDRDNINNIIKEYENLEDSEINSNIIIERNYIFYVIILLIFFIATLYLTKILYSINL